MFESEEHCHDRVDFTSMRVKRAGRLRWTSLNESEEHCQVKVDFTSMRVKRAVGLLWTPPE